MPARIAQSNAKLLKTYSGRYDPIPQIYGSHAYLIGRRLPPFWRFVYVPAMIGDPRLTMAMLTIQGALTSLCHFYIDETPGEDVDKPASEIKKFVVQQVTRWWMTSVAKMMTALEWGWYGAEPLYMQQPDGKIGFKCFRSFEARDVYPVSKNGELVGIELRPRTAQGWGMFLGGEKAFWHVHWRERHRWWGWSRYFGAFEPWLDLHSEGGALAVRRKWYYKHAFQGKRIYHPAGSHIDDTGKRTPYKEIARGLVEQERAGGIFIFESVYDEVSKQPKWRLEEPQGKQDAGLDVREYIYDLKREMVEGVGVSEELFRAAETGSGYSGRRIPETAFRGILTDIVLWMVYDFDEQVLRPLVRRNFRQEPEYEIVPFGLIQQEDDVKAVTGNGNGVPDPVAKKAEAATAV